MRNLRLACRSSLLAALGLVSCQSARPTAADIAEGRGFDGTWGVVLICDRARDGALPYIFRFDAQVTNGLLHGQNATVGAPGYLSLDGRISPDGKAYLTAQGLTGQSDYSVGHVAQLTPYVYHVNATFNARNGAGNRIELRDCSLTFSKA